jgi:hypothetical protein
MASGGYRQPAHPAPVSGPGALSQRTDGGPGKQPVRPVTGLPYGQGQQLQQTQAAAPMSASPGGPVPQSALAGLLGGGGGGAPAQRTPFGAATAQPNTPVTAGANAGPGPDQSALGIPQQSQQDMQALLAYLPVFQHMANQPGSSAAARNLTRSLMAFATSAPNAGGR